MADQALAPSEQSAIALVNRHLGKTVATIGRFPLGYAHYVYDVRTTDGNPLVVRMTQPEQSSVFKSAIYWYDHLAPVGVPLPRIFHHDAEPEEGSFPYMIMERLPGKDLDDEYPELTPMQKKGIANRLAKIQEAVRTLPHGPGFGFARAYDDPSLCTCWIDVLRADLLRSRERIQEVGVVDPNHVDRVETRLPQSASYFNSVAPEAFLDDTTTKNVIIHKGSISGIVDADYVCFGDSLLTVALTRMSLLSSGFKTDYINYWCRLLRLSDVQWKALNFYTALFCVNFLGELGQQFNKASRAPVTEDKVARLLTILDDLLKTKD